MSQAAMPLAMATRCVSHRCIVAALHRFLPLLLALAACGHPPRPALGNARGPVVASESELVLFQHDGTACVLVRIDPVARTSVELAKLPEPRCTGARIAWRPDLARAVVWFDPGTLHVGVSSGNDAPPAGHPNDPHEADGRRFEIVLATHAVSELPRVPDREQPDELAYGRDGVLRQFATEAFNIGLTRTMYLGHALDFSTVTDGIPAAAIVDAWIDGHWQLEEVAATTTGWDLALEWHAAKASAHLGPSSTDLLAAHADTSELAADEKIALERITPTIKDDTDGWARLATSYGPIYIWMFNNEFSYTSGRIAWHAGGTIAELPALGFTARELVSVIVHGRYLLVGSDRTGAYPRLYDLVERRLVWSSETARATTFMPRAVTGR
jgi:hypothetical protein